MPIYEYKCNDCDTVFEVLTLSSSDNEKVTCSQCGGEKVSKLLSAGSIRSNSAPSLASAPPAGCGGNSGFS